METLAPAARQPRTASTAPPHGEGRPPELRGLLALLALDLLAGTWLSLHTDWGPSLYLAHLPVIGLAGVAWALFPDSSKGHVRTWVATQLAKPGFTRALHAVLGLGLALTAFRGGFVLSAVEPNVATTIQVVRGTQLRPEAAAPASTVRLNRLTTPVRRTMWMGPLGAQVWFYTPTHVSTRDHRAWPWVPARLQYPDDFEPMVRLAVVPDPAIFAKLTHKDRVLAVHDGAADGPIVARDTLDVRRRLLTFTEPGPTGAADSARWAAHVRDRQPGASDSSVAMVVALWRNARWVRAVRPLRVGDVLFWEVRSLGDSALGGGRLELLNVDTVLDVSF